jgi:alkanesulfonate monooxygenase SsuD/methylene tetrahydromethanopterin reductase-like flavin-dependent oxidoreductase (luciferase family)
MSKPSFGWITQIVDRVGDPNEPHYETAEHFIQRIRGAFDTLWFDDHFQKGGRPILECWTELTYRAAQHPEFNVGTIVLGQAYRNPALLAKMASTLQVLSGGRLILGLGAGWMKEEHEAFGYPFEPFQTRFKQLQETVQILRTMWSQSPATFEGEHYSIRGAYSKPFPQPPPPLLIGGGGEKYTLRLVAEQADWMNVAFLSPDEYAHKLEVLQDHCKAVGRPFENITKSLWSYIHLTTKGDAPRFSVSYTDRHIHYGTPESIIAEFKRYMHVGIDHIMLRFLDFPGMEGLDLFLEQVLPHL